MKFVAHFAVLVAALGVTLDARAQAPEAPVGDWNAVRKAMWARVVISAVGHPKRTARIRAVDDTTMVIEDLDTGLGSLFVIDRDSVTEILQ